MEYYMAGGPFRVAMFRKLKVLGEAGGWIDHAMKRLAPNTIKNYILALKKFFEFLRVRPTYYACWESKKENLELYKLVGYDILRWNGFSNF